jgi:CRP/FNR family transcriptional regulator, cyclic AMP receptor protein
MRKALYMLGVLDDVDIEWLAEHGTVEHLHAGTVLINEGEPVSSLYIVLEGHLRVTAGRKNPVRIAHLLPGEIVGEISLIDSRPPAASVTAEEDSQVFAISREMLTAKLARDHGFAERFYLAIARFLADRLWVTVGRFGYGSPQQDADIDALKDSSLDDISLAAVRFDAFLKRLRGNYAVHSAVALV